MKKILVFMLLIAMLCITACGNEDNDDSSSLSSNAASDAVSDVNTDTTLVDDTTSAQESSEDPYEGWTWLLGDVYIPNLPFSDWAGQNQDNISCFTIFIKSHNSAAFHTYAQSLADFGYTIEQTESFAYAGTDPKNREIHLTDHENGQMQISIYY